MKITLNCATCQQPFEKEVKEINRRKHKGRTKWYCSISCGVVASNKNSNKKRGHSNGGSKPIYDSELSWYVHVCSTRYSQTTKEWRMNIHDSLKKVWTGKCAISDVVLVRRDRSGNTKETNPFKIASVDRIDSSLQYQEGNLQWISLALNYAKNSNKDDNFKEHFKEVFGT